MKNIKSVLGNKLFDFKRKNYINKLRKRYNGSDVTIISNNCIGGIIYHDLGLKFCSPFINLFIPTDGFIEMLSDLQYYLSCDLVQAESDKDYPVGKLIPNDESHKQITLNFVHYKSFDEAKAKWNERKRRIIWDKIFVIMEFYDNVNDKNLLSTFDKLKFDNKLALTHRKFDNVKNSFVLTCYDNNQPVAKCLMYNGATGGRFLDEFDYVSFLMNK